MVENQVFGRAEGGFDGKNDSIPWWVYAGRASGNPYREEYERFWNRILLYNYKRAGITVGETI